MLVGVDGERLIDAALIVSVLSGVSAVILAALGSPALGALATVGGILLGVLWMVIGVLRESGPPDPELLAPAARSGGQAAGASARSR